MPNAGAMYWNGFWVISVLIFFNYYKTSQKIYDNMHATTDNLFHVGIHIQRDIFQSSLKSNDLQWWLYKARSSHQSWHWGSWLPLLSFWPRWGKVRQRTGRWWQRPWRLQSYPGWTDPPPSSGHLQTQQYTPQMNCMLMGYARKLWSSNTDAIKCVQTKQQ